MTTYPLPSAWHLATEISFQATSPVDGTWIIRHHWTPNHWILKTVHSPFELATFLEALGSGRIGPKVETIPEALARGLTITHLRPGQAAGLSQIEATVGKVAKAGKAKPLPTDFSLDELLAGFTGFAEGAGK